MLYSILGFGVESEIALPDLDQVSGSADLSIQRRDTAFDMPAALEWTDVWSDVWRASGPTSRVRPVWKYAWDGADLLVAIPKCGEFRLENGLRTVICRPYSKTTDAAVSTELSHNLIPRILAELGHLVVHGSCVALDDSRCLLFIGLSGAGKSTLAASFTADGGHLVSDDCVLLRNEGGRLVAYVTGGSAHLWDDSTAHLVGESHNAALFTRTLTARKWTHQLGAGRAIHRRYGVQAIFELPAPDAVHQQEEDIAIVVEGVARLLLTLTEATLLLAPSGRRNRRRRFLEAADVAGCCPAFFTLRYPRRFDRLPDVRRAILGRAGVSLHASMAR